MSRFEPKLTTEWRRTKVIAEEAGADTEFNQNLVRDRLQELVREGTAEHRHAIVTPQSRQYLEWRLR